MKVVEYIRRKRLTFNLDTSGRKEEEEKVCTLNQGDDEMRVWWEESLDSTRL
jgi:hypothetical protein